MRAAEQQFRVNHSLNLIRLSTGNDCKNGRKKPTRRLFLIDIENYCGKGVLTAEDVRYAKQNISRSFALSEKDLIVIGTSHSNNCAVCGMEWRGPRQVLKQGHNGADQALIKASGEYRLDTFASVIVISGDGIFSDTVRGIRARSETAIVAASRASMSRRLAAAASAVRYVQPSKRSVA